MTDWTKTFVRRDSSLREVIETIDAAELRIAIVVDEAIRLQGLITDGDVRRALLRGLTLSALASEIMTVKPLTVSPDMRLSAIDKLMQKHDLQHIPVVNEEGVLVSLALHGKLLPRERYENQVILMVGGMGSRLGDLTKEIPKPLLKIGEKPILEIIMDSFLAQGFYKFSFAVNYKAEIIEHYFGNGSRWGAEINYLREQEKLGTCGALSLLKEKPDKPFLVMNGDLITKINFKKLLEYHQAQNSLATMAVREYEVQIPFGVARLQGERILELIEKPTEHFFVNAGIYALSPDCLDLIPKSTQFDMTTLFQTLITHNKVVCNYPIKDYWLDIGRADDFQKAHADFMENWEDSED